MISKIQLQHIFGNQICNGAETKSLCSKITGFLWSQILFAKKDISNHNLEQNKYEKPVYTSEKITSQYFL